MLSISMIKLCGDSICKPLSIIFNDCLKERKMIGKKLVLYQSTRKEQCLKNYRPISLLQSAAKNWKYLVTILLEKITHLTLFFKGYFYFLGTPISRNTFQWLLQKTPTSRWISRNLRDQIRQKFFGERQWIIKLCAKYFMKMFPDSWNTESATERCLRVVTL